MARTSTKRTAHYHACTRCHVRYEDTCENQGQNEECSSCRRGELSRYQESVLPRECCLDNCRLARKDELKTYDLRGGGNWWICATCARQFGRNPKEIS